MTHVLKIECIGDDSYEAIKGYHRFFEGLFGVEAADWFVGKKNEYPPPWWVAEITGRSGRYRWERRFLRGEKDYSRANSVGSRGIFLCYILEEGKAYEIKERVTWRRTERYFARIEGGKLIAMTDAELEAWLPR